MDEKNDFGFTIEDTVDNDKVQELFNLIMPLLNNLAKNPDKDVIKWPGVDRFNQINYLINKIHAISGIPQKTTTR